MRPDHAEQAGLGTEARGMTRVGRRTEKDYGGLAEETRGLIPLAPETVGPAV